jgi:hypothetical protein
VVRSVNINREPTTFVSKSPDIFDKIYLNSWGSKSLLQGMRATSALPMRNIEDSSVPSDRCKVNTERAGNKKHALT